jgi:FkbM family methyltransferase
LEQHKNETVRERDGYRKATVKEKNVLEENSRPTRRIIDLLNRRGCRWLLGIIVSIHATIKRRKYIRIFYDGVWVHETREGFIVDRRINSELSPSSSFANVEDFWLLAYKPAAGDTVVDVGAGIGEETFFFSKRVGPQGRVVSIEAHPGTYLCLRKLCDYNKLKNVTPLNLAVQGEESDAFIDDPKRHVSSTIVDTKDGIRIKGVTLDHLTNELGIEKIDFLKMNIEGAEKAALAGMTETIKKTRYICVSCHDFLAAQHGLDGMRTKETVSQFLLDNNFEIIPRDKDKRDWFRDQLNGVNRELVDPR